MRSVYQRVEADLAEMPAEVANSGYAQLCLAMAAEFDRKPTALMARELREALLKLREIAPPKPQRDVVDELKARRVARRA